MSEKTKFILHGGYTSTPNEWNRTFYEEFGKSVSDGGNVLLIYFSRKDEEVEKLFEEDKERIIEHAKGKRLNIILAKEEEFMSQLESSQLAYMRGGSTRKLLSTLKKFPKFSKAIEGKTIAGSSAGAYVLSTYYYSSSEKGVFKGLEILPIKIMCHYDDSLSEAKEELIKDYPDYLELVLLKDNEWRAL